MAIDKVHIAGMSQNGSTYLTVDSFYGPDNREIRIEPPVEVILEGDDARSVAFSQGGMAARYSDEELRQIGGGSSMLGTKRVIGEIAMNGNLERGAIKPLHPNIYEACVVAYPELPAPARELNP
jgi:hypothetical protein